MAKRMAKRGGEKGISPIVWILDLSPFLLLDRVTMQLFVGDNCTMIAAPIQCDVDGIAKGSHYVFLKRANGRTTLPRR